MWLALHVRVLLAVFWYYYVPWDVPKFQVKPSLLHSDRVIGHKLSEREVYLYVDEREG